MEPHVKKILAVVVLIALAYTGFTILNCTLFKKTPEAGKKARRPVTAGEMLTSKYKENVKNQRNIREELDKMATLDAYSPEKAAMKHLGAQGMVQLLAQRTPPPPSQPQPRRVIEE